MKQKSGKQQTNTDRSQKIYYIFYKKKKNSFYLEAKTTYGPLNDLTTKAGLQQTTKMNNQNKQEYKLELNKMNSLSVVHTNLHLPHNIK